MESTKSSNEEGVKPSDYFSGSFPDVLKNLAGVSDDESDPKGVLCDWLTRSNSGEGIDES